MYESLCRQCDDFHLFFFAFDEDCYKTLQKLNLRNATIIPLTEFEDEELLKVKPSRNLVEYCWTCTPSVIKYALDKYNLDSCTYLDADLYFWSSPLSLLEEKHHKSVIITEHRYTHCYDQAHKRGKFCVQFVTFQNDGPGREVLEWWRKACNQWCYARFENGKFGDQKYLDRWPEDYGAVHVLRNLGGGVAPWNIQQYEVFEKNTKPWARVKDSSIEFAIVFYHFHHVRFLVDNITDLGGYRLSVNDKKLIYQPYIRHVLRIAEKIKQIDGNSSFTEKTAGMIANPSSLLRSIKHRLQGNFLKSQAYN
jgi:hypothetical protein